MHQDPTRDEMLDFLSWRADCETEFEREEAIYWFAYEYHGGQGSNLYEALCNSPYSPGPLRNGPEDTHLMEMLVRKYGNDRGPD